MKRILLLSFMFMCALTYGAWAQRTVSGTVTSQEDGGTIPGVNVVLKGTTIGATSDLDGNYRLTVPEEGGTLVFSFIGLAAQEVEIGARSVVDVKMESDVQQLTEVVVTGVGHAVDKRKVAIAVESVGADEIKASAPSADLSQALVGKVPGSLISSVTGMPGTQQSIILRGINTLQATQPMILVDGVQINTDNNANGSLNSANGSGGAGGNLSSRLADLDLSNVERIEVVQGSAAATIYGAQGANGVIQIFTKKGQKGKPKFSFGTSYAVNSALTNDFQKSKHHHFNTVSDGSGAIADGAGSALAPDSQTGIWAVPAGSVDGTTITDNPFVEQTYDHLDQFFNTAATTNTYLNVSGGSDALTYLVSGSYLTQESVINGDLDRLNLRLNLSIDIAKNVTISSNSNYIISNNTTGTITGADNVLGGLGNVINLPQYVDLRKRDALGNFVANPTDDNSINPFYTFDNRLYEASVSRIIQNFNLNWKATKFLTFDVKYGYDNYLYDFSDFIKNQSNYLSDAGIPPLTGQLTRRFEQGNTQNAIASIFTKFNFEKDFNLSLPIDWTTQIAYDYRRNVYGRTIAQGSDVPTFTDDINLAQTGNANVSGNENTFVTYGYLVNTKFDYDDKIGVSGGFRSDWSSAFGSGSKPFTFPRADIYVRLSEFDFWSGLSSFWAEMKIRAAYGQAGVQPGAFERINTLVPASIDQSNSLNVNPTLRNPALNVQVSTETEFGLDMVFNLGNSGFVPYLNLGFTYWDRSSQDVIRALDIAPSTGSSSLLTNALTFESDGIQASLSTTIVDNDNFDWNFTTNFSKAKNVLTDISNDADITLGNNFVLKEGAVVGAFFGFTPLTSLDQTRADGTRYIDAANESLYEVGPRGYVVEVASKAVQFTDDKALIGDPTPDFNISFINDFVIYKNLAFGFQIDWVQGFDIYNQTKQWLYRDLVHADVDNPITIGGETAAWTNFYQSLYKTNDPNAGFVEDGSFVRMRSLYLSYNFANVMKGVETLKLTFSGNNLFTITDYSGLDPEANSFVNDPVSRGLDQFAFPNFKTYSVRLDITF